MGNFGIIHHSGPPVVVGAQPTDPPASDGQLYKILDRNGQVVSAGYQGSTQKHPLSMQGGQLWSLGSDGGILADATTGWNILTGSATQGTTGINVVADVTNPSVIIDMPFLGQIAYTQVMVLVAISGATPANGNYVGIRLDSVKAPGNFFSYRLQSDGVVWNSTIDRLGSLSVSTQPGVAFGSVSNVNYVMGQAVVANTAINTRNGIAICGELGQGLLALDNVVRTIGTGIEDLDVPDTWEMALEVFWAGGSSVTVELQAVAALAGNLPMTTVD